MKRGVSMKTASPRRDFTRVIRLHRKPEPNIPEIEPVAGELILRQ
jgi:hypothetical protein